VPCWLFKRNNGLGPEVIYANNDAVLVTYPTAGLNVLSKGPTWDVVSFNTKNHIWYHESLLHYRARKNMPPAEKQLSLSGRRATRYADHDAIAFSTPYTDMFGAPTILVPKQGKTHPSEIEYFFSKPLSLSKESTMFINSFFGVPASG
jgi:hypothetical protein